MSNLLYNKNTVIGRLFCYFSMYFTGVPVPTAESLCLLLISMLALESAGSVRSRAATSLLCRKGTQPQRGYHV